MSKIKPIAEVIRAPEPFTGFVVRCTRYPNGRLLPDARILLDTSGAQPAPFATAFRAMEAMKQFQADPRSCKHVDLPKPKRRRPGATKSSERADHKNVTSRDNAVPRKPIPVKPAKDLPPVVKLMPDMPAQCLKPRDAISQQLRDDAETNLVHVTKCPTRVGRGVHEQHRKHGGVMPGHLNPLTMGES